MNFPSIQDTSNFKKSYIICLFFIIKAAGSWHCHTQALSSTAPTKVASTEQEVKAQMLGDAQIKKPSPSSGVPTVVKEGREDRKWSILMQGRVCYRRNCRGS